MDARCSCAKSLGGLHPGCAGPEGLQGFADGTISDGTITGGVSQRESASLLPAAAAYRVTGTLPESLMQGTGPPGTLASGRGSAGWRMNLTACGNAAVPGKVEIKNSVTARILRWAEDITFSRPDL